MAAGEKDYANGVASGEVTGTGALLNVAISFSPIAVTIYNRTTDSQASWVLAMGQGAAQKTVTSGAGTTDISFVTTNAISSSPIGFSIGTDADLNNASDQIYFVALGR